jgi:hypothetical protein
LAGLTQPVNPKLKFYPRAIACFCIPNRSGSFAPAAKGEIHLVSHTKWNVMHPQITHHDNVIARYILRSASVVDDDLQSIRGWPTGAFDFDVFIPNGIHCRRLVRCTFSI